MHIHEFGEPGKPVMLLLPGTMCYWRGNFGGVIDDLARDFLVAAVAYTGFDEEDAESSEGYVSVTDELARIERAVAERYGGAVHAAYGCSLGGTFVAHLIARGNIRLRYGIIGSSDFDQAGTLKASLLATIMVRATWNFIHTGSYRSRLMRRRFERQMTDPDPEARAYNRAFVAMTGRDRYDLGFITRQSLKNQFRSDLVTPLPAGIDRDGTEIHVLYAQKMGEKNLERYRRVFAHPHIHELDLRHEELLGVYPERWCALMRKICLG